MKALGKTIEVTKPYECSLRQTVTDDQILRPPAVHGESDAVKNEHFSELIFCLRIH